MDNLGKHKEYFHEKRKESNPYEIQKQNQEDILKIRNESSRFLFNYYKFIENHPNIYKNIAKKHPQLTMHISYMENILDEITDWNNKLSDEQIKSYALQYNSSADQINKILTLFWNGIVEKVDWSLWNFIYIDKINLSKEEKKELIKISKDLYKEIFPDSRVNIFVKNCTWEEELEDYQKILLAPANWVENMVIAIFNLLKLETYEKFYKSWKELVSLNSEDRERLYNLLKVINYNISDTDKIAALISFIFWLIALNWASKMISILSKRKISTKINKLLLMFWWFAMNTEAAADLVIIWKIMTTRFDEDWINL